MQEPTPPTVDTVARFGVQLVREPDIETGYGIGERISGPADVAQIGRALYAFSDRESFAVLMLTAGHDIIGVSVVTVGVLDGTMIHPREIFKPAILASAAALVLLHNHPSGDPTPSAEDRAATRQIVEAGQVIGIPVLDHVVIGDGHRFVSFVEAGLMEVQP